MSDLLGKIFGETLPGLQKVLSLTMRRNEALVSNIANSETPGYRAVDLNFSNELKKAFNQNSSSLTLTNSKHMDTSDTSGAHIVSDFSGATKADGNNVDIDIQMGRLTFNSGRYSMAANLMRKQLTLLKQAIREGNR